MNKFMLGGASTVAVVLAAAAAAQPAPRPNPSAPQVQIMRAERGAMRAHSRDDAVRHVRELFAKLDGNRDGFISRVEADAGRQAMRGTMRKHLAERLAQRGVRRPDRGAAFDRLDANKDGMVSRQEFMSAPPRTVQRRMIVMRERAGAGAGGMARMRMHRMGMGFNGRRFEMADSNGDGRVSLQEATAAALRHFDMADANHDGQLTPDERMQMRKRIRAERHRV